VTFAPQQSESDDDQWRQSDERGEIKKRQRCSSDFIHIFETVVRVYEAKNRGKKNMF
jgi:hypothetical protein